MNQAALIAAERGATFLDDAAPGWTRKIVLDRLDMGEIDALQVDDPTTKACVLCQLADVSWDVACTTFGRWEDNWDPADLGFDVGGEVKTYGQLDEAWRHVITNRRIAAGGNTNAPY